MLWGRVENRVRMPFSGLDNSVAHALVAGKNAFWRTESLTDPHTLLLDPSAHVEGIHRKQVAQVPDWTDAWKQLLRFHFVHGALRLGSLAAIELHLVGKAEMLAVASEAVLSAASLRSPPVSMISVRSMTRLWPFFSE